MMACDVAGLCVILAGEDAAARLDLGDPGDVGGDAGRSRSRQPR